MAKNMPQSQLNLYERALNGDEEAKQQLWDEMPLWRRTFWGPGMLTPKGKQLIEEYFKSKMKEQDSNGTPNQT